MIDVSKMSNVGSVGSSVKVPNVMSKSLEELKSQGVLMVNSHFDYGNGYHGTVYLNPHRLFQQPATIWRFAQDLIARLPVDLVNATEVVSGPVMGGALLAHTIAGLLDGHRPLSHPSCCFAPLSIDNTGAMVLRTFYRGVVEGKRVLLVDDVKNTGKTFERAKALIEGAGGTVIATVQICDRLKGLVDLGVPNIALADYPAPENYPAQECPLCQAGVAVAKF